MFSNTSFDLKVMYLVLFVGYLIVFITESQYIGYAIMLLSLMGIFVINIGLASKSNMENSFSSITIGMMSISSIFSDLPRFYWMNFKLASVFSRTEHCETRARTHVRAARADS